MYVCVCVGGGVGGGGGGGGGCGGVSIHLTVTDARADIVGMRFCLYGPQLNVITIVEIQEIPVAYEMITKIWLNSL